jgi:membrane-associated phospholipid phosphatase
MVIIIVLLVLAVLFGVGSVIEGLAWLFLVVVGLLAAAAFFGYKKLTG